MGAIAVADTVALLHGQSYGTASDEAALIHAARTEPEAFGELCNRYSARLYSYLRSRSHSDDDAADLTQQVFLKAIDALPRYRDRGAPFGAWLFRIAHNLLTDMHRRHHVTVSWDLLPESLMPAAEDDLEVNVLRVPDRFWSCTDALPGFGGEVILSPRRRCGRQSGTDSYLLHQNVYEGVYVAV